MFSATVATSVVGVINSLHAAMNKQARGKEPSLMAGDRVLRQDEVGTMALKILIFDGNLMLHCSSTTCSVFEGLNCRPEQNRM